MVCYVFIAIRIVLSVLLSNIIRFIADDRFQAEYDKSIKYLDVDARINLLNRRLEVLKVLNSILMDAVHKQHSSMLEWIVIVLIVVFLMIEIFRWWIESTRSN